MYLALLGCSQETREPDLMQDQLMQVAERVYEDALRCLIQSGTPFMVGGQYAMRQYTGIVRDTKDFDVFCKPADYQRLLAVLAAGGFEPEVTDPTWIVKAFREDHYIDIIFSSGNGVCRVDDSWFEHARDGLVLGFDVKLVPAEEIIWSKIYIQERERFDGADVLHIIREQGETLDWGRLLERIGPHWEVLLAHLLNFRFVYPAERETVPEWLMQELLARAQRQPAGVSTGQPICRGPLLSRYQYVTDIEDWGYRDVRPSVPIERNGRH